LTQAESYCHRGPAFADYSQLEFESIVQFQDRAASSKNTKNDRGQKPRPTFLLGLNHPLYSSHVGVICMKMCTPMLAGASPPKFPRNRPTDDETRIHTCDMEMKYYSKYLIDLCVPWSDESRLLFERSATGFCNLVNAWNKKLQPSLNVNDIASCQISCQKDIVAVIMRLQLLHDGNEMLTGGQK
jgi:hypothetical protein